MKKILLLIFIILSFNIFANETDYKIKKQEQFKELRIEFMQDVYSLMYFIEMESKNNIKKVYIEKNVKEMTQLFKSINKVNSLESLDANVMLYLSFKQKFIENYRDFLISKKLFTTKK